MKMIIIIRREKLRTSTILYIHIFMTHGYGKAHYYCVVKVKCRVELMHSEIC